MQKIQIWNVLSAWCPQSHFGRFLKIVRRAGDADAVNRLRKFGSPASRAANANRVDFFIALAFPLLAEGVEEVGSGSVFDVCF